MIPIMKTSNRYVIEYTPEGIYYAYLLDYKQCCAYGETEEEALDSLYEMEQEYFNEVLSVYTLDI